MMKNRHFFRNSEKGQSIVLIALAFVGLLAFIGLTVDLGVLFIGYGNLRRGVDNAALAAATRLRESSTQQDLERAAAQFLQLNDIQVNESSVNVQTCATDPGDAELCYKTGGMYKKLIRVTATVPVKFSFLPIIGFYGTDITASAIAEAASMDVVLIIDISESMTKDTDTSALPNGKDPAVCNAADADGSDDGIPGECQPFSDVKEAAANTLIDFILDKPETDEEDRVAIVVFSNGWQAPAYEYTDYNSDGSIPTKGTHYVCPESFNASTGECDSPWISSNAMAKNIILNMKVYESPACPSSATNSPDYDAMRLQDDPSPCAAYDLAGNYLNYSDGRFGLDPMNQYLIDNGIAHADRSTESTTNIGGGLKLGASLFAKEMRKDALWLAIMLTDGTANATEVSTDSDALLGSGYSNLDMIQSLPIGWCPSAYSATGKCRDGDARWEWNGTDWDYRHPETDLANYDADDFAMDMADLMACDSKSPASGCSGAGQGSVLFAVGLGSQITNSKDDNGVLNYGDNLLRYIGAVGDDGNPLTNACDGVAIDASGYDCGNYYFTPTGAGVDDVFQSITSRIYTRLTK